MEDGLGGRMTGSGARGKLFESGLKLIDLLRIFCEGSGV